MKCQKMVALLATALVFAVAFPAAAFADSGSITRYGGDTRYETSNILADQFPGYPTSCQTPLVVCSGENFPDALAAASIAGDYYCPILIVNPNELGASSRQELEKIDPPQIVVVGGEKAVSSHVYEQLTDIVGSDEDIFRIAGTDRYETSLLVAEQAMSSTMYNPGNSNERCVIIAAGNVAADALCAGPMAFRNCWPIVLSAPDGLSDEAVSTISDLKFEHALIIGGAKAVPTTVDNQLEQCGIQIIDRLAGQNRIETSYVVAKYMTGGDFSGKSTGWATWSFENPVFATAWNYPDALGAASLASCNKGPVLLVSEDSSTPLDELSTYKGRFSSISIIGGKSAISSNYEARIRSALM